MCAPSSASRGWSAPGGCAAVWRAPAPGRSVLLGQERLESLQEGPPAGVAEPGDLEGVPGDLGQLFTAEPVAFGQGRVVVPDVAAEIGRIIGVHRPLRA